MNGLSNNMGSQERINVEFINGSWVVKNNGDSSVLFSSFDKGSAEKFAEEMSEAHDIGLKIYPRDRNSKSPVQRDQMLRVNVEKRDGTWIVRKADEREVLFSSGSRDDALEFAESLDTGVGIDLHVDRD